MPETVWYLYVLRCADGTLYTGVTTDLARRQRQHDAGRGAALRREAAVKALTRAAKERLIRRAA